MELYCNTTNKSESAKRVSPPPEEFNEEELKKPNFNNGLSRSVELGKGVIPHCKTYDSIYPSEFDSADEALDISNELFSAPVPYASACFDRGGANEDDAVPKLL
jgi:hypothetical protein